jgi:hypothetical protein
METHDDQLYEILGSGNQRPVKLIKHYSVINNLCLVKYMDYLELFGLNSVKEITNLILRCRSLPDQT